MLNDHLADISAEQMETALHIIELHERYTREFDLFNLPQLKEMAEEELRLAQQIGWRCGMIHAHFEVAKCLSGTADLNGAITHLASALALTEARDGTPIVAAITSNLARYHFDLGNLTTAAGYTLQALSLLSEETDPMGFIRLHGRLSNTYHALGEYDKAIDYATRTRDLARNHGFVHFEANALLVLSMSCIANRDHNQALSFIDESLALYEQYGFDATACPALLTIAAILADTGEIQRATQCVEKGIEIARQMANSSYEASGIHTLGVIREHQGDLDQACSHYETAYKVFLSIGSREKAAIVLNTLGTAERERGRTMEAINRHRQALEMAKQINARLPLSTAHLRLYECLKEAGDIPIALEHIEQHYKLRDEIFTEESDKRLNEVKVRYELDKAQSRAEIEHLRAEQLQYQLDAKQHELTATAMSLARQSELLGRFRNDLRQIMRDSSEPLHIVRKFREKLQELPCEAIDWTRFEAEFQGTYPEFRAKLMQNYPMLTKMEVRICSLVKVRLTTMDISQLLCLSERTVENHRMNIRKKMELGKGEDLYELLAGI
jgi:tetratricopeptide (TPR) repeat protein/DNA-binding CsgD family transcriptional regulator